MGDNLSWLIVIGIAVGASALLLPLWFARDPERADRPSREQRSRRPRIRTFTVTCGLCDASVEVPRGEIRSLAGTEAAMIVSERPAAMGRKLGEFDCPECRAHLAFYLDTSPPVLIGTNLFEVKLHDRRCADCSKVLAVPDEIDRNAPAAQDSALNPACGLVCERCGAICCFECLVAASRNRVDAGALVCSRCHRGPVTRLHDLPRP